MEELQVEDKVSYWDGRHNRTGVVIEIKPDGTRARIKWDDNRPRTWIRVGALVKLNS